MNFPLNVKYKPQKLNDFILGSDIKNILTSIISNNIINLLFIGPDGSGKTSIINIILNEYYGKQSAMDKNFHENIIVINSLKERGIHFFRNELKTFCQVTCTIPNKKRAIIIDDMDLINEQSQQVCRNFFEKYSHNVFFLCSSSNLQKIIEPIQSKMFIVKTNLPSYAEMMNVSTDILDKENIKYDREAVDFLIKYSNNSIKMLINYFEKIYLTNLKLTLKNAINLSTNISFTDLQSYTNYCKEKNFKKANEYLFKLIDKGFSIIDIIDGYFSFIKIENNIPEDKKYKIIKLLCKYTTIFYNIHDNELELYLLTYELSNII